MQLKTERGQSFPLGATICKSGVNFAVFARNADCVYLELFQSADSSEPYAVLPLDSAINKTGDVWHILVKELKAGSLYLYRVNGEYAPEKGLRFDNNAHLIDPYAKELTDGSVFKAFDKYAASHKKEETLPKVAETEKSNTEKTPVEEVELPKIVNECDLSLFPKCVVVDDSDFDWEDDKPLCYSLRDSVFYELHLRGYTKSHTSKVKNPGTYDGLIEKIPYLKNLGITAVEILPVFEFDENENGRKNPKTGEQLKNFWGYSTFGFFAPKHSYSSDGAFGGTVKEFKRMVKELHKAGIEVILDVVFNHTAEGNHLGHTFAFKGFANDVYYILEREDMRYYSDYTGCGNTMNCNHPVMVQFILDCLRYWVLQMHVDGFRFDLASVFCRSESGMPVEFPYITRAISEDSVLHSTKIIAEPWDAGGLYHAGHFPGGRWCDWNDRFRDGTRRFFRGEDFMATEFATRLAGSSDMYSSSNPTSSINFVTVHDGFTLNDVVSYMTKHNEANGENNNDGSSQNYSYNNGAEGATENLLIDRKRLVSIKNMLTTLVISQGVPLLLAGDEFRRTQMGNNNAYCQDNDISWVDWSLCEQNADLVRFVQKLIQLRKEHFVFRRSTFFKGGDMQNRITPDILWYDAEGKKPDWSKMKRFLACRLDGNSLHLDSGLKDNDFYFAANMDRMDCVAQLPPLPPEKCWRRIIDTAALAPEDICDEGFEEILPSQRRYVVPSGSVVLLFSEDVLQNKGSL